MLSPEGTIGVTFNGEIYGYKEIKSQTPDYPYRTESDTEVILALYQKYGENFVQHMPGMFAFGLWDDTTHTLIAARDRFGEKPFFYATTAEGELIFASEIKAILATGLITPKIDPDSLAHYLHKLYVHPTRTIYKNIHTLPPAHMLLWRNGTIEISRYWDLPKTRTEISLTEALPEFKRLLTDAVRKQLVADVPVGAFLSGGLDSTTVVALASEISPHIKTFAFGFDSSKNELSYAKMAADKYGTDHFELHDTDHDVAGLIMEMAHVYDEPFADSSNIPTYLISKKAREHTTVALSGDGADELLGGYGSYKKFLPPHTLIAKLFAQFAQRPAEPNVYFTSTELATLLIKKPSPVGAPVLTDSDRVMRDDLVNYMPGDILVKTDRASMAHALELRAPFLDQQFAEFAISLPYRLKVSTESDKIILREAFADRWPEPIRTRTKQGFGAPVAKWLKQDGVQKLITEYLGDKNKKIFSYLPYEESQKFVAQGDYKAWILLVLSIWMEQHTFEA